ncbi:rRNA-processing protein FCF1 [Penicillium diatomitis]|uniref:rRNA-processing protein FCF1 n=1 Tax=Penicillium diatomitis TaxID=2819901 RepID=A0A9X0BJP5_9EURO|nr:rRNA-processing protein FCF1 [Penicillium diatomitis]KAJ5469432.1 rRNA-processing protein FCF1 [Penicillium diatomitis]
MGVQKKTRKFAVAKRTIQLRDSRLKANDKSAKDEKSKGKDDVIREANNANTEYRRASRPQVPSSLFFQYNTALTPPYSVLVDTNFISHTIQHKLDVIPTMMDCLYAKCIPIITDCVLAELEKLGQKYRLALRVAKDPRFERIKCDHKGTYADDCLVDRVIKHRVYIVATNDRDLKRRIRKIPGAPIMSVARGKYVIERLPDAPEK